MQEKLRSVADAIEYPVEFGCRRVGGEVSMGRIDRIVEDL
jgi:hypothetical protein